MPFNSLLNVFVIVGTIARDITMNMSPYRGDEACKFQCYKELCQQGSWSLVGATSIYIKLVEGEKFCFVIAPTLQVGGWA